MEAKSRTMIALASRMSSTDPVHDHIGGQRAIGLWFEVNLHVPRGGVKPVDVDAFAGFPVDFALVGTAGGIGHVEFFAGRVVVGCLGRDEGGKGERDRCEEEGAECEHGGRETELIKVCRLEWGLRRKERVQ